MKDLTRRQAIGTGAAGTGGLLLSGRATAAGQDAVAIDSRDVLADHQRHEIKLSRGGTEVTIDSRSGAIIGITRSADTFRTNFLASPTNATADRRSAYTGDLMITRWRLDGPYRDADLGENVPFEPSGTWQRGSTASSHDIRSSSHDATSFSVRYTGDSREPQGLTGLDVSTRYALDETGWLVWDFTLTNRTADILEIGELGCVLNANDDYREIADVDAGRYSRRALASARAAYAARTQVQQALIHEQKVIAHHFVSGNSSYSLLQRPLGDAPLLLVQPAGGTALECLYRADGDASGPDVLAVHSNATKDLRGWSKNQWINGHSSLTLKPGESRSFQMRMGFVASYDAVRARSVERGNLGIRVLPSMVVQQGEDVRIEITSDMPIGRVELLADNAVLKSQRRIGDRTLLILGFGSRGTKPVKIHYGAGRWTTLHFNCVEPFADLIKARARFAVDRQFYDNPNDRFHRHHMFLPFDHRKKNIILTSDEVWEVGGSDEPGFSTPLFLAEKNVHLPVEREIAALESYVKDSLFRYIQDPRTFDVRASLYWVERRPSSPWSEWDEKRSKETWRTYNYVHPANIYHALYRIGSFYGLLKERQPREYLYMSYRSAAKWFDTGAWRHVGLMEGSNAINILLDLEREGMVKEADDLRKKMEECHRAFVRQPYPYSSELLIDQTAHEQVYFFTKFFGAAEKNRKTVQVMKALRGGNQPVWFLYGNDKRGTICCWYSASLNGMALLDSFERSGDQDALAKGFGGLVSVVSNIASDGMGFNYFDCRAGVTDYDPPNTWEGGCGLWGYLRGVKAYVVEDPAFGIVGYGCRVERSGGGLRITPTDGLRKRVFHAPHGWSLETSTAEIEEVAYHEEKRSWRVALTDPAGVVRRVRIDLTGLVRGRYRVRIGSAAPRIVIASAGSLSLMADHEAGLSIDVERVT